MIWIRTIAWLTSIIISYPSVVTNILWGYSDDSKVYFVSQIYLIPLKIQKLQITHQLLLKSFKQVIKITCYYNNPIIIMTGHGNCLHKIQSTNSSNTFPQPLITDYNLLQISWTITHGHGVFCVVLLAAWLHHATENKYTIGHLLHITRACSLLKLLFFCGASPENFTSICNLETVCPTPNINQTPNSPTNLPFSYFFVFLCFFKIIFCHLTYLETHHPVR